MRSTLLVLALALALAACALPETHAELEQAGTVVTHDTPWFKLHYYAAPHPEAPIPNCPGHKPCYTSIAGAHLPGVPDYVEDLGVFLEEAFASYRTQGYDLPQTGQIPIYIHHMDDEHGTIDMADGAIRIHRSVSASSTTWTIARNLRDVAWHELFHVVQFRAFEGAPPWTHYNTMGLHRWMLEASATDRAFAGAPVPGVYPDADPGLMQTKPLVIDAWHADSSYAAFAFLRYVKQRYNVDLAHRWFNASNPIFTVATVSPTAPIEAFFYDDLATLFSAETRRDMFRMFGLAYQFTRDNALVPGIRNWLGVRRGHVHQLTGYERVDPGTGDEEPLALERAVDGKVGAHLDRGHVVTFVAGLANVLCTSGAGCNPEAIPVPEIAEIQLQLRGAGIPHYGAVWRVPSSGQPELLETFADSAAETDFTYPLSWFSRSDVLAITVVADPEVPTGNTLMAVFAGFDNACRSKVLVVDHPQSQVGFYGGAGKLIETEKGCKKMLVKIWGGGGPLITTVTPGIHQGDGGGGAFVGARIPIDPAGEQFRASVPFSSLTGTPSGSAVWVYQPATPPMLPTVLALAGGGGGGGRGWGWTPSERPHGGGAHEAAPDIVWTSGASSAVMPGGGAASDAGPGQGAPHNNPAGNGKAFDMALIPWHSAGHGPCAQAGSGGAGWFGGGGGDVPPWEWTGGSCGYPNMRIGSGGGGGSSFAIASRLSQPVTSIKIGGTRRVPGNEGDPDRMSPPAPGTSCQGGAVGAGNPGYGRLHTDAWCDNPGRIVIKFGKAAATDVSAP